MELIEQLGGYERAKAFLNAASYTMDELIMMQRSGLRTQHVKKALLEYRRQHNIFEEGDICKLKIKHDFGLYKFRRTEDDRIYLEDRLGFAEFGINKGVVEHATDDEIAVGHRIDGAKDLDDGIDHCSDIRNHIGPNVVVIEK